MDPIMDLHDSTVFARVYAEHHRSLYTVAYRVLGDAARAQDVVQDVFMRLWTRPTRFDASRGDLGPYLRLMARSRALDLWREGQAAGRASDRVRDLVAVEGPGRDAEDRPEVQVARDEERTRVRTALTDLPIAQREALVLAYWGGLTADEIAQRTDTPLGTAKSRIRLGLARLRGALAEHELDEVAPAAQAA
jgi:RNA polymerase sigma-70 factor, ECF subfamily